VTDPIDDINDDNEIKTIIRNVHNRENPYVMLNKKALWDERLSLKAIGLWSRCLSLPNDWKFTMRHLISQCKEGRKAIDSAMYELIQFGYAMRLEFTNKDSNGKFCNKVIEYIFFEFEATEEEKVEQEEIFKKSFRDCRFGDFRRVDFQKEHLLSNNTSTKKREELSPAPSSPLFSSSLKRKKTKELYSEVYPHVNLTPTQQTSILSRCEGNFELVKKVYEKLSVWKIGKGFSGGKSDYVNLCDWVIDSVLNSPKSSPINKVSTSITHQIEPEEIHERKERIKHLANDNKDRPKDLFIVDHGTYVRVKDCNIPYNSNNFNKLLEECIVKYKLKR
jgi:hypothetical protein